MTNNYLDMTVIEFLDTITNKKQEYSLKIGGKLQYIGTKPELQDLLSEVSEEEYSEISTLFLDKEEYITPFELTSIEIYNYLEKITSKFNLIKVKLILQEMEMYKCMVFNDRINEESLNIYMKNEWNIPSIEFNPFFPKGAPPIKMADLKTMTRKTHFCASWNIDHAISLLKDIQMNGIIPKGIPDALAEIPEKPNIFSSFSDLKVSAPFKPLNLNIGQENYHDAPYGHITSGPNWDLINAGIEETHEANKKDQVEIHKRAYIEAFKELNATPSDISQHIIQKENVSDNKTIPVSSLALNITINQNEVKFDAEYFICFMKGKNPQKDNGLILGESNYKRLILYTNYLISECKVPLDIIPMPKTNLNNQDIVYTYSLIHDRCIKGTKTTKEYIVFIIKVFSQFTDNNVEIGNNYKKTTAYSKFRADEPRDYKRLINS